MYCTQADLESRIGADKVAQLCADTAGAPSANPAIVSSIISMADILIDSKAGQVYITPMQRVLSGTISSAGTVIAGSGTSFTSQLNLGDALQAPSGEIQIVTVITSDTVASVGLRFSTDLNAGTKVSAFPGLIHEISSELACFYAMQRRFASFPMPKSWEGVEKSELSILEDISNLLVDLPGATIKSAEADFVPQTPSPTFGWTDTSNPLSMF